MYFGSSTGSPIIDLESDDPLQLVDAAFRLSSDHQSVRADQVQEDYLNYRSFVDMDGRDNTRAHVFIPKIYEKVEIKSPRQVKALLGTMPYIPMQARRKEFQQASKRQEEVLNSYLDRADFYQNTMLVDKMATLYGTAFIENIPIRRKVIQKFRAPVLEQGPLGQISIGIQEIPQEVQVFEIEERVFMPSEIYVDPYAIGLEKKGQCRYAIKFGIVTRDEIARIAPFAYPDLDIEAFLNDRTGGGYTVTGDEHIGYQALEKFGLPRPSQDSTVGVLIRFESENRYIDTWNGWLVLRDVPNPYNHGLINLSRMVHNMDPHTNNRFWGIGEAQPLAVLQSMLNDLNSQAINVHNVISQPIFMYDPALVGREDIVWEYANRIPVAQLSNNPNALQIVEQPQLPAEHYILADRVERWMDTIASGIGGMQRSEGDPESDTATEAALLKEAGDVRMELNIRNREQIYLKDVGKKVSSIIDQYTNKDDLTDILGQEGFLELAGLGVGVNPEDLPGGYDFTFKGSNSISNQLVEKRNEIELFSVLAQSPNVRGDILAKWLLEKYEKDQDEIEEAIIPQEVVQLLQMMAAQQAEQQQGQSQNGSGSQNQKGSRPSRNNSTGSVARDNARTIRGQQQQVGGQV